MIDIKYIIIATIIILVLVFLYSNEYFSNTIKMLDIPGDLNLVIDMNTDTTTQIKAISENKPITL